MKENRQIHEQLVHTSKQKKLFEVKLRATQIEIDLAFTNSQKQTVKDNIQGECIGADVVANTPYVQIEKQQKKVLESDEDVSDAENG